MHCPEIRSRLGVFADGEIRPDELPGFQRHLDECEGCRRELEALREVGTFLARETVPELPAGFRAKVVMAADRALKDRELTAWGVLVNPPRWWRAARLGMQVAAAAAVALGVGLGALLGSGVLQHGSAEPAGASFTPSEVYAIDYLSESPSGSLSQVYLALAQGSGGEGE